MKKVIIILGSVTAIAFIGFIVMIGYVIGVTSNPKTPVSAVSESIAENNTPAVNESISENNTIDIKETTPTPKTIPDNEILEVDYQKLYEDFDANPINAERIYGDKLLMITGNIDTIGEGIMGEAYIIFTFGRGNYYGVRAAFKDSEKDKIAELSVEQTVSIIGKYNNGAAGYVYLKDCYLYEDLSVDSNDEDDLTMETGLSDISENMNNDDSLKTDLLSTDWTVYSGESGYSFKYPDFFSIRDSKPDDMFSNGLYDGDFLDQFFSGMFMTILGATDESIYFYDEDMPEGCIVKVGYNGNSDVLDDNGLFEILKNFTPFYTSLIEEYNIPVDIPDFTTDSAKTKATQIDDEKYIFEFVTEDKEYNAKYYLAIIPKNRYQHYAVVALGKSDYIDSIIEVLTQMGKSITFE